ncbi:PREDICTED: centromere-associated protein E isoform X1 [Gavialis gangeticus]|uniref:centromere-associated protein E isoform X1 n=1 Tax=Gavialis gangeticus TaxID=94835 RepID=UPI00092E2186|nr:PREDICTED: centromere-associated protein E isoform X1 [Gavialis gangeticus]
MVEEGAVTVCVRVRPLIASENGALQDKAQLHWQSENCTVSQVDGMKSFIYDRVFHSHDGTENVYEGVAVPIIKSAVQGYNGTIFAYGQTASGKTYTMMGNETSVGIIPKAIHDIFKLICAIPDREFLLRVSYMEIYNETITDLLCDNRKKKPLGIREDVNRNTYVEDLIEEVVVAPEQVLEWIRKGEKNRHYGETKMNQHSSRSHTIFRMIIESRERSDPANTNCDGAVMVSHLNLVDLAGSERARQTGAEGLRLKEGCNINRSLFILGQVIKKLCDDPSCFINYRDSKLTRILQNSLGGNAKTVIICTVTPVSFDETLSTLQFANTAKGMKNTPKVNEVLDDDALLKRYRKEILDLKKQLEEVSSTTHLHAMEKDQLAQLLEEKNSLQKVQEDKIRNLTEMLVTSASFSSKQDFKAKRKRRVTWAPGKVSQKDNVNYLTSFEMPRLTDYKKLKTSLSALPDVEDSTLSEYSECDFQNLPTPDSIAEVEWTSGHNMDWSQDFAESIQLCETLALEKDIAVNEANVLQASFDNLVLENEQLKQEISELKVKLKEKIETDEFEELEKQMQKDHEIQLMHEITNLKSIVANAEVYNEELEAELKSKLEQLKGKESKIQNLQKQVEELQKSGIEKKDESLSVGDSDKLTDEIQQLNKSLIDTKTVALDAKKESAFLRSENLELKERMNEVLNNYKQMEREVQLYQSQLQAGKVSYKKMQADLQKELQSAFQENTKLNSLLEGKVPKELFSLVELERETAGLKTELNKALEENVCLRKEVDSLSEFRSLPDKVEVLQKEILDKSDELCLLTSEREKLVSEVADKETQLKGMSEEIRNSKQALEAAQLKYDQEYLELKHCHEELEQKYLAASEENEQMKLQVEHLANDAQKHKATLDDVRLELSRKMQELQEKTAEQEQLCGVKEELEQAQQWLCEMEQLKEQLKISESRMEAKEVEGQTILQKLHGSREEIRAVIQDRDELKQKYDSLQTEMDQLTEDIKETVTMNILAHEELRDAQSSLKQYQQNIKELEEGLSKKRSEIVNVQESLQATIGELELKVIHLTEELKQVSSERDKLTEEINTRRKEENDQLQLLKEQVLSVTRENTTLQEKLEGLLLEKEPCKKCSSPIQQLQEKSVKQEQLLLLREEMSQAQQKFHEVEEMKYNESRMESPERTKIVPAPKLYDCPEINSVIQERDYLKMQLEALQCERDYLKDMMQETSPTSSKDQELIIAHGSLKQHQEMTEELKRSISEKESQLSEVQEVLGQTINELQQKVTQVTENLTGISLEHEKLLVEKEHTEQTMNECIYQQLQKITSLTQARDDLQQMLEDIEAERDQLKDDVQENKERSLKIQADMENLQKELNQQKEQVDIQNSLLAEKEKELQRAEENLTEEKTQLQEKIEKLNELVLTNQKRLQLLDVLREETEMKDKQLQQLEKHNSSLTQEKDQLQQVLEDVRAEKDQLETYLQESTEKSLKIQADMENLQKELKQQKEQVDIQSNLLAQREKKLKRAEEETTQLQEKILETQKELKQHQELINNEKNKAEGREAELLKVQRQSEILEEGLKHTIHQVTDALTNISSERDQLLAEKNNISLKLQEQISSMNQEKDELQKILEGITSERDQLKTDLQKAINMCNETNEKLELALDQLKQKKLNDVAVQSDLPDNEEQIHSDSLDAKALEVKLLLEKFPKVEKRYDCFTTMSLNLETQLNSQKEQMHLILKQLSSEPAKQVKRLQTENERISSYLQSLLKKLQFLFSRTCLKKGNYYGTVNKCEMELLDKKREAIKQQILQDVSAMETEALGLEDELQQEQRARQEAIQFLEMCSETCDIEKLKDWIKQENERLLKVINLWSPKVKPHFQALLDIDRETANYCQNFETELKQRKEKTEDMLQELKTTKEELTPCSTANLALEEENYRLCNKLKTTEQDVKIMKAEVKKLENTLIEMEKNVKEKEERIAVLLSELKRRSAASELTQLHAKLNETEKYLKSTLTEKQTLEVKLNKGAELYTEEIDNLKTQLVKSDMERMKQSKFFEREIVNAKALAKHKEEQLRKLKEELRRAQQEQNVSVMSEKELPQASQVPLTCGGGSGIVQSTQMLVLKSEQVKLQKENLHLKKQNDILLSNEHQLKKELTKWKERALKLREVSSRGVSQEMIPRSPKKTASLPCKEQILSPKEHNLQAILPLDTPKPLLPTCPTNFFDNSNLGTLIDARPGGIEPTEEQYKHWLGVSEKDEAPECTTQ